MPLAQAQLPPRARTIVLPAPIGGLNSRDALAEMPPNDAPKLDNWFPMPTAVNLRNGCLSTASSFPAAVQTLAAYNSVSGANQLFAAANGNIYNATSAGTPATGNIMFTANPVAATAATGTIAFTTNPAANTAVTINGTVLTFVVFGAEGLQVNIGSTLNATLVNLVATLQASNLPNLLLFNYSFASSTLTVTAQATGTQGNAYTLATTVSGATPSGATLAGGSNPMTVTLNGNTFTFVASGATGLQSNIGTSVGATLTNLVGVLNTTSSPASMLAMNYAVPGTAATGSIAFTANPMPPTAATGDILFTTNPTASTTIALNGTAVTFVASGATGLQCNIGASLSVTLSNLLTVLQGSANANLVLFHYAIANNTTLDLTAATVGTGGNVLTIATTVSGATTSGSTLTGGTNAVTITLNGSVVTFVSSGATGLQSNIGTTLNATLASLLSVLQASTDSNLVLFQYAVASGTTTLGLTAAIGSAGNALTISTTVLGATASGATLAGGTGGNMLNLTAANAGTAGNALPYSVNVTGATAAGATLSGGTATGPGVLNVSGMASSQWQKVPFGSTAANGQFLYLVNGVDAPQLFNGITWQAVTATSTPIAITGLPNSLTPASFIQGVAFKQRLYFVIKGTTQCAYLPVNSLGGAAGIFDFGGFFRLGGYLQAVQSWTVDNTAGLNEFFIAISSNGEVVVFEGYDPTNAANWSEQAYFRIGRPIGYRCVEKLGSDLVIICADGLFPLKEAMLTDRSQESNSISDKIRSLINEDVQNFSGNFGWQVLLYPIGNKVIVNVPNIAGIQSYQYVMNTLSGAWCRFTGWNAFCFEIFNDALYFGGLSAVYQADVGLSDNGGNIAADAIQAFNFFDAPGQQKIFTALKPLMLATNGTNPACSINVDYDVSTPAVPTVYSPVNNTLWGSPWGSPWSAPSGTIRQWRGAVGVGDAGAVHIGLTVAGAQCQWQSTEVAFQVGGPM